MRPKPFVMGQYVELSLKGRRYLKKSHPYGHVIGVRLPYGVKVKFESGSADAEWWPPEWFQDAEGERLDGIHAKSESE